MTDSRIVLGSYEAFLFGFDVRLEELGEALRLGARVDDGESDDAGSGNNGNGNGNGGASVESSRLRPTFAYKAHREAIKCVVQGPKNVLVSGSNDECLKIYDLKKQVEAGELMEHEGVVTAVACYGKHFISASTDGSIGVWRRGSGTAGFPWTLEATLSKRARKTLEQGSGAAGPGPGHTSSHPAVLDISLHPSGRALLAVGQDSKLRMYNLVDGSCTYTERIKQPSSALPRKGTAAAPQPPTLVSWTAPGDGFVWAQGSAVTARATAAPADQCQIFRDAGGDGEVLALVCFAGPVGLLGAEQPPSCVAYGGESGKVVVRVLDLDDPEAVADEPVCVFEGHSARVKGIALLAEGYPYLVSVDSNGGVCVWHLVDGRLLARRELDVRLTCVSARVSAPSHKTSAPSTAPKVFQREKRERDPEQPTDSVPHQKKKSKKRKGKKPKNKSPLK